MGFAQELHAQECRPEMSRPPTGNPTVNFHCERRSNATHQPDPEVKPAEKGARKEAKLCHSANALMENQHVPFARQN